MVSPDPEDFGVFYDRYARSVLGYFARRVGHAETAADLTAETFACALEARPRYERRDGSAAAWLFAIAGRRLADFQRRGYVAARAQKALAMRRVAVVAEDAEMIRMLADDVAVSMLAELPVEQRDAVRSRVLDEEEYEQIAAREQVAPAAVRQRVSRGLAAMRRRVGVRQ